MTRTFTLLPGVIALLAAPLLLASASARENSSELPGERAAVHGRAAGQEPQPIFKSSVRTVPVYATVIDASGRLVPELEQSDFTIVDNGKPADIALFSNESQPFTAVVMLDTSASMTANLKLLNRAAEQFLLRLLPRVQRQDPVERHLHHRPR
jgi:Mg-chelatase subunit ChlD